MEHKDFADPAGNQIEEVFAGIPKQKILNIADSVLAEIRGLAGSNADLVWEKQAGECVTKADLQIQQCLLEYFSTSVLAGQYMVKAEEALTKAEKSPLPAEGAWQLIIDPLDGTDSFSQEKETWGTMIGLCDRKGRLCYSWNMISSGEVYSSSSACSNSVETNWTSGLKTQNELVIEVFDYGAGAIERFPSAFKLAGHKRLLPERIRTKSFPCSIWAGWEMYNRRLDGMLWLPSERGKKIYPDYDLVFVGALRQQGWQVALGKSEQRVELLAIAPSREDLETLWQTGMSIIGAEKAAQIVRDADLTITNPI